MLKNLVVVIGAGVVSWLSFWAGLEAGRQEAKTDAIVKKKIIQALLDKSNGTLLN